MQTPLALSRRPLVRTAWLPLYLAAMASAAQAAGPTGLLNDTGQTRCLNRAGNALEACSAANTGDGSARPGQDGRFGRDAAAGNPGASGFSKPAGSGGNGGFAFIPLDVSGTAIALTGSPPVPSATPRCIRDTVTNLIWEVKTDDNGLQDKDWSYGWGANTGGTNCLAGSNCNTNNYIIALNAASVCPVAGAGVWRLPTRRELLSIVDHGRFSPAIDVNYFPNTVNSNYWSATGYAPDPAYAWSVHFSYGGTGAYFQSYSYHVRLVRSGQ